MKIAIVSPRANPEASGGAERFYEALGAAFRQAGHAATELVVPADEPDFDAIQRNYLACYDLDVSDFDFVVSTKAPTWLVRHPRHVCYLVHTIRVFYDMFESTFPNPTPELLAQRQLIHQLDSAALSPPRCKAVFSIGFEVSRRLSEWNHLSAEVLHPPLWNSGFHTGPSSNYLLMPGRLHEWKRVDLAIRAMKHVKAPLRLLITGTGEAEAELRSLAADDPRIEFRGRVTDEDLVALYAGALAVPFLPLREDYGYVTLEAFASGKPVVTCTDSGEAAAIVATSNGGYVVPPEPSAVAAILDQLCDNPELACSVGGHGSEWVAQLSWGKVVERLISAAGD